MRRTYTVTQKVWGEFHGEHHDGEFELRGGVAIASEAAAARAARAPRRTWAGQTRQAAPAGANDHPGGLTMAGALQIGRDIVGVAKQTAQGALAANPTFAHGVASGDLPAIAIAQADDPMTSAGRAAPGAYRNSVDEKFAFDTRAWQKSIGLYILGLLGNDAVSGTGPYTHVLTQALTVPYLSMFAKKSDGTIVAVRDSKITKLEWSWSDNQPVVVSVETDGCVLSFPATFAPATDESGTLNYYTPVGGTFKYDVASTMPAVASVVGGKITIAQDVTTPIFSGAIEAGDALEGNLNIDVSLDCIPADATLWRKILTGSTSRHVDRDHAAVRLL